MTCIRCHNLIEPDELLCERCEDMLVYESSRTEEEELSQLREAISWYEKICCRCERLHKFCECIDDLDVLESEPQF